MAHKGKTGFSEQRLENVSAYMRRIIDKGLVAGAGAYIARHGEAAYCESFGFQDIENRVPMKNDSIYRIYSMSKTFTIVAAMTLYEKGLFKLHDPIAEFLPSFADMQVAEHDARGIMRLVPANRPITFEHLFTMTSGIPYPGDDSYSARRFAEYNPEAAPDSVTKTFSTAQAVELAARVPLCFHPGDCWLYGFSHDVLGRLVEILSGKRLSDYMKETLFDPLDLRDTGFFVPAEKQSRVTKVYSHSENGLREAADFSASNAGTTPPLFEMGGAGLTSTLRDVGRYGQMLLNKGEFDGNRVLSRKTIDLIRRSHILETQHLPQFAFPSMAGYAYGLGVRTMADTAAAGLNGSDGEWAWDGMLGTWYCVDPVEDMVAVFLIQRFPGGNEDLPKRFAQTVYGAIAD